MEWSPPGPGCFFYTRLGSMGMYRKNMDMEINEQQKIYDMGLQQ